MATAVCPGSFDPITLGHVDIIRRAAEIFDEVVVCVMHNAAKKSPMFTLEEKLSMARRAVEEYPNVRVDSYDGLLTEYVRRYDKPVVVKGLRAAVRGAPMNGGLAAALDIHPRRRYTAHKRQSDKSAAAHNG